MAKSTLLGRESFPRKSILILGIPDSPGLQYHLGGHLAGNGDVKARASYMTIVIKEVARAGAALFRGTLDGHTTSPNFDGKGFHDAQKELTGPRG